MDIPHKIYIAIVEDSNVQAKKLKYLLEENNYEVSVSSNAQEALQLIEKRAPNLVISDIIMPGMDGYELCNRIKTNPKLKDLPVILLTTLRDPLDIIKGLQAQADNFIIKPYEDQYLLMRIQYLITNLEFRKQGSADMVMEIIFRGQRFHINSERKQILDLLLSVYEAAISRNEELITTQNTLQNTNKELIAANKELEAYSRTVSHDLRSPIAQIKSLITLMQRDIDNMNIDSVCKSIEYINRITDTMLMLVDDLLNFSKAKEVDINRTQVDITLIAEQIIDGLKLIDPSRNVSSTIEKGLSCSADEKLIYILMENLLSNAWKFTAKKNTSIIEVGKKMENGTSTFYIKDNGAGFDMSKWQKLYIPFERLHSTADFPGIGIGLSTVKRIIERHGGFIKAESIINEGSTFFFSI